MITEERIANLEQQVQQQTDAISALGSLLVMVLQLADQPEVRGASWSHLLKKGAELLAALPQCTPAGKVLLDQLAHVNEKPLPQLRLVTDSNSAPN